MTPTTEQLAHAVLTLVADMPGRHGRLRAARIVGGFAVPHTDDTSQELLRSFAVPDADWSVRQLADLVDAMTDGELLTTSIGARPVLVLTRSGWRALASLDAVHGRDDGLSVEDGEERDAEQAAKDVAAIDNA